MPIEIFMSFSSWLVEHDGARLVGNQLTPPTDPVHLFLLLRLLLVRLSPLVVFLYNKHLLPLSGAPRERRWCGADERRLY